MTATLARAVLFDLDGTLVDTAGDLGAATNAVLRDHDRPPIAIERLRPAVSRGSRALLELAFPDLDASARETLVPTFLHHYEAAIAVHSVLFDGIESVLQHIERQSCPWGIVTNKPEQLARQLLAAIALAPRCAVLIGGDTLARRKPDPLPLLVACRELQVDPRSAVYVGDDARDVEAALAAGMKAVAVAWGYRGAAERIEHWGAHEVLDQPSDLLRPGVLSSLLGASRD
jgi:N-acetyl-D-muramate 6-phosphate phosphatase